MFLAGKQKNTSSRPFPKSDGNSIYNSLNKCEAKIENMKNNHDTFTLFNTRAVFTVLQ